MGGRNDCWWAMQGSNLRPLPCEGFPAIVGCAGYREIPLILGAAGVGGVGCGRFGATVVLHARCTPKITHHVRRKRPNAGPNRIPEESPPGLPYLAAVGRSSRAIDDRPQCRPSWTGTRIRTPRSWAGSWVTPSRSTQRFGADRSAHVYRVCAQAVRRSTSTTCTGLRGIRRVCRCMAAHGFRTGATALRGRGMGRWLKLDNIEGPGFCGSTD